MGLTANLHVNLEHCALCINLIVSMFLAKELQACNISKNISFAAISYFHLDSQVNVTLKKFKTNYHQEILIVHYRTLGFNHKSPQMCETDLDPTS